MSVHVDAERDRHFRDGDEALDNAIAKALLVFFELRVAWVELDVAGDGLESWHLGGAMVSSARLQCSNVSMRLTYEAGATKLPLQMSTDRRRSQA